MKTVIAFAIALAAWLIWGPRAVAAQADMVVLEVHGLRLRPGQVIDGRSKLTLQDGQRVVLISSAGRVVKLQGPLDAPPFGDEEAASVDVAGAMNALITQSLARNDRAGIVRGTGPEAIPPEPWLVNVTQPGLRCLPTGSVITVWRPGGKGMAEFSLIASDRSWRATAIWPAGVERLELPRDLPLPGRASYMAKLADKEVNFTLITLPDTLTNDAMRVAWMEETGCEAQALALLRHLRDNRPTTPEP